jgi:hypothetical protein
MKHYEFTTTFRSLYDKAVGLYARGQRGADSYFTAEENAFLAANGITAQHLYDYAEDQNGYGEPDFGIALGIELIRRDYFLNVQQGRPSAHAIDGTSLPAKTEAIRGMEWLPRLIPKARAKLRGELPASLMYCCGGDRKFFKTHDILPTEFLNLIWRSEANDAAVVDWVLKRSTALVSA